MKTVYIHDPDDSFYAQCWWQLDGVRIDTQEWDYATPNLAPIWVQFYSGDGDDGWMRSEPEGAKRSDFKLPVRSPATRVRCELLWFGLYRKGLASYYEIRPVDDKFERRQFLMEDDGVAGYVGMYDCSHDAGLEKVLENWYQRSTMWQIEGLPATLQRQQLICNLRFISPGGYPMNRYKQFGRPYFYTGGGTPGLVAMRIIHKGLRP
ncbi:hypothetical protein ACIPZ8_00875 [Pseudomonas sp. NPDC089422]|uniref:hypothetical protein n=1 Tax=Pseudomonas sp. NPDC089422 TaxID=3364466 RepID=UPI003812CEC6